MTASFGYNARMKPFEVIEVTEKDVACSGSTEYSTHPRVFLHIDRKSGQIQCPYCSRLYVLKKFVHKIGGSAA